MELKFPNKKVTTRLNRINNIYAYKSITNVSQILYHRRQMQVRHVEVEEMFKSAKTWFADRGYWLSSTSTDCLQTNSNNSRIPYPKGVKHLPRGPDPARLKVNCGP